MNEQNLLRFDLFKFLNKQSSLRFDLFKFWNKLGLFHFDIKNFRSLVSLRLDIVDIASPIAIGKTEYHNSIGSAHL
jgi:hypothetical protein